MPANNVKSASSNSKISFMINPHVNFSQLMKMICMEFELDVSGLDVVEMVDLFYQFLLKQYASPAK